MYHEKIKREDFYGSRNVIKSFSIKEDGTYDFITQERLDLSWGYQVSFETNNDNYTDIEYDELVYKFALMNNDKAYIGVYMNTPEISFYYDNFEFAYVIAISYNQMAIWDWGKNDEIKNPYYIDYTIKEKDDKYDNKSK